MAPGEPGQWLEQHSQDHTGEGGRQLPGHDGEFTDFAPREHKLDELVGLIEIVLSTNIVHFISLMSILVTEICT